MKEHDELVAHQPGGDRLTACETLETIGDGLKKLVAGDVASRVIDVLEFGDVYEQEADVAIMRLPAATALWVSSAK
jgi:hypothetical protein